MKTWILIALTLSTAFAQAEENRKQTGDLFCGVQDTANLDNEKIYQAKIPLEEFKNSDRWHHAGIHGSTNLELPGGIVAYAEVAGGNYGYTYFLLSIKKGEKVLASSSHRAKEDIANEIIFDDTLADMHLATQLGTQEIRCELNYR